MTDKRSDLVVVVLAAGSASRFGGPKQLARYQGKPLVSIALKLAASISEKVILVTGAYVEQIRPELQADLMTPDIQEVYNPDWQTGMGSSIRMAVSSFSEPEGEQIKGAIFLLADQPLVTESHLQKLVACWCKEDAPNRPWAVATGYESSLGVPALFDKKAFDDLASIEGDQGARLLLNTNAEGVMTIEPNFQLIDIDTPEQLAKLEEI